MDNYATHKTAAVKAWLARRQHWHVHFTPTSASWINQVERWFAELTRKQLQRGVHHSTRQLEADIRAFIDKHNEDPKPFKWTKSADDILGRRQTLLSPSRSKLMPRTLDSGDYDMWHFSMAVSRMHIVWNRSVAGRHGSGVRYTASICYHTFPVPKLTEQNKADLTRCAEDILLAREAHFPATIADLYDPERMPGDLRAAHERNDEVLERIYIGRRFRNDTERLEKLFEMYTKMTEAGEETGQGYLPGPARRLTALGRLSISQLRYRRRI